MKRLFLLCIVVVLGVWLMGCSQGPAQLTGANVDDVFDNPAPFQAESSTPHYTASGHHKDKSDQDRSHCSDPSEVEESLQRNSIKLLWPRYLEKLASEHEYQLRYWLATSCPGQSGKVYLYLDILRKPIASQWVWRDGFGKVPFSIPTERGRLFKTSRLTLVFVPKPLKALGHNGLGPSAECDWSPAQAHQVVRVFPPLIR